jgi:multimeric flavodoxin WrbA/nitrite reductase/ring-hydroxylating ferredoxin subunit
MRGGAAASDLSYDARMNDDAWIDAGALTDFPEGTLREVTAGRLRFAVSRRDGHFGAISGACNHVGGPLGQGRLEGDYVVCPWHYWKFNRLDGRGEPGYEEDCVPAHPVRIVAGRLWVGGEAATPRQRKPHAPHPLARPPRREEGPIRILGLSTTAMTAGEPRYSTSEDLLEHALRNAGATGCDTRLIRIRDLKFRECEGFYSKSARACTWPCSITQMDASDQMDQVYEGLVHWADVILVATPIRWGVASSLYFKMVERMNCIQNQETLGNRHLLKNKVAGFIVTGGQDNVQAVAGQLLGFFGEIGCQFPQFPYIAHSRGWSAEDMEQNQLAVQQSTMLHDGAAALARRCVEMAQMMVSSSLGERALVRGGRKAHRLDDPVPHAGD